MQFVSWYRQTFINFFFLHNIDIGGVLRRIISSVQTMWPFSPRLLSKLAFSTSGGRMKTVADVWLSLSSHWILSLLSGWLLGYNKIVSIRIDWPTYHSHFRVNRIWENKMRLTHINFFFVRSHVIWYEFIHCTYRTESITLRLNRLKNI